MKLSNLFKALSLFLLMSCVDAQEAGCSVDQDSNGSYYFSPPRNVVGSGIFTYKVDDPGMASIDSETRKITPKLKFHQRKAFVTVEVTQEAVYRKYKASKKYCRLSLTRNDSGMTVVAVGSEGSPQITPTLSCPKDMIIAYGLQTPITPGSPASNSQAPFTYHIDAAEHSIATVDERSGNLAIHGVGEAMIQVKQAKHGNYDEASCQYKLTVRKINSVIYFPNSSRQAYPPSQQTLQVQVHSQNSAVRPTGGRVSLHDRAHRQLASADLGGDGFGNLSLDFSNPGLSNCHSCTLEVRYDGGKYHQPSKADIKLTVSQPVRKDAQTIQFPSLNDQIYSGKHSPLISIAAHATSGLPVTLQSKVPAICQIENGRVRLKSIGRCMIVARQSGNDQYDSAEEVSRYFQIKQESTTQIVTCAGADVIDYGQAVHVRAQVEGHQPTGEVSFFDGEKLLGKVSLVNGEAQLNNFSRLPAGQRTLTAVYSGDMNNSHSQSAPRALQVKKITQTITFAALNDRFYADASFQIAPGMMRSSSGLPVSVQSVTPEICVVDNGAVKLDNIGTCTLVANQAGDDTYAQANEVRQSFQVKMGQFQFFGPSELRAGVFGWSYGTGEYADSLVNVSGQGAGVAPYTYRLAAGETLPPGLSLDPSGKLSALSLTQVGSYAFTVAVYDSRNRHVGSRQYTMNVNKKPGCIAFDFYNTAQIESIALHHQEDKNKIDLPGLRGFCKKYDEATVTQNYLAFPKKYAHAIQYKTNDVVGIEGSKIVIRKAGRASIEAIYLPNENEEGASTSYHFTVERAVSNIALTVEDATYGDKIGLTAHVAGYKPTGSVQFFSASHLLGTASLNGHVAVLTVDQLSGGTHTLHAVYSGDTNNQSSQSPIKNLFVRKTAGHISFPQSIYHVAYGEKFVFPQAQKKTASKGRLSYHSLNPEIADVDSMTGEVKTYRVGTAIIVAKQQPDTNYNEAEAQYTLIINHAIPTLSKLVDLSAIYAPSKSLRLEKIVSPSQGKMTYRIAADQQGVASIDSKSGLITIHGVGVATIIVKQNAAGNYAESLPVRLTLTVNKSAQNIVDFAKPADLIYGAAPFDVTARATSALPVTFSAVAPSVCTVTQEGRVTVEKNEEGFCNIKARQVGNENYHPAKELIHVVRVSARKIDLNHFSAATYNKPYAQVLTATGGVLPYTYALAEGSRLPEGLVLANGKMTGTIKSKPGKVDVTVMVTDKNQTTVKLVRTIHIAKGDSSIVFSAAQQTDKFHANNIFHAPVTVVGSQAAPEFASDNLDVCQMVTNAGVAGWIKHINVGQATITVTLPADDYYKAASARYVYTIAKSPSEVVELKLAEDNGLVRLAAKVKSGGAMTPTGKVRFYQGGSPGDAVIKEPQSYLGEATLDKDWAYLQVPASGDETGTLSVRAWYVGDIKHDASAVSKSLMFQLPQKATSGASSSASCGATSASARH